MEREYIIASCSGGGWSSLDYIEVYRGTTPLDCLEGRVRDGVALLFAAGGDEHDHTLSGIGWTSAYKNHTYIYIYINSTFAKGETP